MGPQIQLVCPPPWSLTSVDDAISIALPTVLTHPEHSNTYVAMLFIDFNSAFNTVIPDINEVKWFGCMPTAVLMDYDFLRN